MSAIIVLVDSANEPSGSAMCMTRQALRNAHGGDRIKRRAHLSHISRKETGEINANVLARLGDRLKIFSASAHVPLCVMLLGGVGWMAGPACLIPRQSVQLYNMAMPGHEKKSGGPSKWLRHCELKGLHGDRGQMALGRKTEKLVQ